MDLFIGMSGQTYSVYLCDGLHFINAMADRKLNNDIITGTVDVFDIVLIS